MQVVSRYAERNRQRERLEPIPGFDPKRSVFDQMDEADFLLAKLVMDAEAYSASAGQDPSNPVAGSIIAARKYLEAKRIVPESVYYGGHFFVHPEDASVNG